MENKIEIKNITKEFEEKKDSFRALNNVSLNIKKGEFISILGPSGCGKSTLLSIVEGLSEPTQGEVLIDGKVVHGPGLDRAVVFQNYSLFPWMTAKRNIAYGIEQVDKQLSRKERNQKAEDYLEKVKLSDYGNKYPLQLSGGQQQRVAIARALAMNTEILLMDEPFGALDPRTRHSLQKLLLKLWKSDFSGKKTVLFVTHDIDEAIYLSDRIVLMKPNPGEIYEILDVPFARPRKRDKILLTDEYRSLKYKLTSLFREIEDETDKGVEKYTGKEAV